jgi:hypothetical protein
MARSAVPREQTYYCAAANGILIRSPRRRSIASAASLLDEPEGLRGLEIDYHLEFCRRLDRQINRLRAFENAIYFAVWDWTAAFDGGAGGGWLSGFRDRCGSTT